MPSGCSVCRGVGWPGGPVGVFDQSGVMHDKAAAKGIIVTTAWFGKASKDFAYRTGRMELIDGRGLKALLLEHLGIDALISLPKTPPGWETRDHAAR